MRGARRSTSRCSPRSSAPARRRWRRGAAGRVSAARRLAAWAASSSRASTRATSRCTRPHSRHQPDAGGRDAGGARERLLEVPEVEEVFARIGTAEVATDPMPPNVADTYVMLKPRQEWPDPAQAEGRRASRRSQGARDAVPGNNYEFTQPIEMRFNELISGVRSDVAVKVFGDDLDVLLRPRARVAGRPAERPGAADVKVEQVAGLPMLTVELEPPSSGALRPQRRRRAEVVEIAVGGRAPARCSRATGASISWCGCPERCADLEALRRCRSRCRRSRTSATAHARAVGQIRRSLRSATCRSRSWRRSSWRPAPTRSAARTASAGSWSGQRRGRDLGSFVAEAQSAGRATRSSCPPATGSAGAASSSNWSPRRSA